MIQFSTSNFVYIEEKEFNRKQILYEYGYNTPNIQCKFIITDENKIIKILSYFDILLKRTITNNIFIHSNTIFSQAREYFHSLSSQNTGSCCAIIDSNGQLNYILEYINNKNLIHFKREENFFNFEQYSESLNEKNLIFFQPYKTIIFEALEEYTYHIVSLLLSYDFKTSFIFCDKYASLFFNSENITILDSTNDLMDNLTNPTLFIKSTKITSNDSSISSNYTLYHSLEIMTLLHGKEEQERLSTNVTKPFYIFNSIFNTAGLVDIIRFSFLHCIIAEHNNYIPVINLNTNNKQYLLYEGDNVWEYYFKPFSCYSLDEAYASDNYLLSSTIMSSAYCTSNPFSKTKTENIAGSLPLKDPIFHNRLHLRNEIEEYCKSELPIHFNTDKKILGVIARGTDYNSNAVIQRFGYDKIKNIDSNLMVKIVRFLIKMEHYDFIYLATEDAQNYIIFSENFQDILISTEQERINSIQNNTGLIANIPKKKCGYEYGLDYLVVLYSLSHCDSLLSSMACGAYYAAQWLNESSFEHVYLAKELIDSL